MTKQKYEDKRIVTICGILDKNENNEVVISSNLGLSIVNGQLCVSYEKEVKE